MEHISSITDIFGNNVLFTSENGEVLTQRELQFLLKNLHNQLDPEEKDLACSIYCKVSRALGSESTLGGY